MVVVKFNKNYRDKELKQEVKAGEEVEMTLKRADEVVKNIRSQSGVYKEYTDFSYERVEEKPKDPPEDKTDGSQKDSSDAPPVDDKKEKQGKGE